MSDMSGHVAPQRDDLHTLTLRQLEAQVAAAGVLISRRQLMRHCAAGTFDAKKLPATNNVEEWFVAPESVEKGIADIKTLQEHRARRDASRRDATVPDGIGITPKNTENAPSHVASQPHMIDHRDHKISNDSDVDIAGHDASFRDASDKEVSQKGSETEPATARHSTTEFDIFEHPYVKKLESQVEKWEGKYHDQVRRTEEIQLKGQAQLLELQRMTAVGQSQTLADFMLKAREWVLGPEKKEADAGAQT